MSEHSPGKGDAAAPMGGPLAGAIAVPPGASSRLPDAFPNIFHAFFPPARSRWSDALVARTRRHIGGCCAAVEMALRMELTARAPMLAPLFDAAAGGPEPAIVWRRVQERPDAMGEALLAHMRARAALSLMMQDAPGAPEGLLTLLQEDKRETLRAACDSARLALGRWADRQAEDTPLRADLSAEAMADLVALAAAALLDTARRPGIEPVLPLARLVEQEAHALIARHDEESGALASIAAAARLLDDALPADAQAGLEELDPWLLCALIGARTGVETTQVVLALVDGRDEDLLALARAADIRAPVALGLLLCVGALRPLPESGALNAMAARFDALGADEARESAAMLALPPPAARRACPADRGRRRMTRAPTSAPAHAAVRAQMAADGRLTSADEPFARLQIAAGGQIGTPLLVPQVAALARLAQKLQTLISRPVIAGGDGCDVSMWVRARPEAGGVGIVMHDWREVPMRLTSPKAGAARAADIAMAGEGWRWRTDAALGFIEIGAEAGEDADVRPGMPLAALFDLSDHDDGAVVLGKITERRAFYGRLVRNAARRTNKGDSQGGGQGAGWFRISGHALFDADARFCGYAGTALPLAGDEAAAQEAQEAQAVRADEPPVSLMAALPDFSRRLDAALRQPIGRIIANADTISEKREGPLRQDYAGYAADIAHAGRHLMELVDDLADLQAIDRPHFQVAREPIDLADIARRTAGLLGVKAADKRITIEPPRGDESLPATGEFRRALQIMVNLVGNAIRYGPEESSIWLRGENEEGFATITVADQGRGIAAEDHDRVFEKFERLGREDMGGSGLGLYISRRLARAMGGDITLDSAPGQGARFTLRLPRE